MIAQIIFPRFEGYMVAFTARELPRVEKALKQRAKKLINQDDCIIELNLRTKLELMIGLEFLTQLNQVYLYYHPRTKRLYESGVEYEPEAPGMEEWLTIPVLYRRGVGDCEDLAAALCAERRQRGISCDPFLLRQRRVWHVMARCGEVIEDPSKVLGMNL